MSVDRTIEELSGTLSQLGQLVGHLNNQLGGITGRINVTLDNFDRAVVGIAADASSVTGQVGNTVQAIPNSWVFYMLFITLIVVFILLSVVLFLNLITKVHNVYYIVKNKPNDGEQPEGTDDDSAAKNVSSQSGGFRSRHTAIDMDTIDKEPPGMRRTTYNPMMLNNGSREPSDTSLQFRPPVSSGSVYQIQPQPQPQQQHHYTRHFTMTSRDETV